jgi:antitoxin VapB
MVPRLGHREKVHSGSFNDGRMVDGYGRKVDYVSLNIKDEETHAMVRELAALKGTTLTTAVKLAVKGEIEREKAIQGISGSPKKKMRSEVVQAFAREFVSRVKDPIHSWDIDKLLYDDMGLPK